MAFATITFLLINTNMIGIYLMIKELDLYVRVFISYLVPMTFLVTKRFLLCIGVFYVNFYYKYKECN